MMEIEVVKLGSFRKVARYNSFYNLSAAKKICLSNQSVLNWDNFLPVDPYYLQLQNLSFCTLNTVCEL